MDSASSSNNNHEAPANVLLESAHKQHSFVESSEKRKQQKNRPPTLSLRLSSLVKVPTPTRARNRVRDEVSSGKTYGAVSRKGKRRSQREDVFYAMPFVCCDDPLSPVSIFGVFDGHGGTKAAQFARSRIPELLLQKSPRCQQDAELAMRDVFLTTDKELNLENRAAAVRAGQGQRKLGSRTKSGGRFASVALQSAVGHLEHTYSSPLERSQSSLSSTDLRGMSPLLFSEQSCASPNLGTSLRRNYSSLSRRASSRAEDQLSSTPVAANSNCGTTATVVFLLGSSIVFGQVGDSRAVITTCGKARRIFEDQRPCRPDELERIESSGGLILHVGGTERVNGVLAVSRAIGDPDLKEFVIADPETTAWALSSEDSYLLLASDGLWDKVGDQECADFIARAQAEADTPLSEIAAKLVSLACERGSNDDVTVLLVDLSEYSRFLQCMASSDSSTDFIVGEPCDEYGDYQPRTVAFPSSDDESLDLEQPQKTPRHLSSHVDFADPMPTPRNKERKSTW